MKKGLGNIVLTAGLALSVLPLSSIQVDAKTVQQNNQSEVEQKVDSLIKTAINLVDKATYVDLGQVDYQELKFRCASFIDYVFGQNGLELHNADEKQMIKQGIHVDRKDLQKGDLLFFTTRKDGLPNHVAMYIGDNKVVHAANKELGITVTDMTNKSYYTDSYIESRRVIPSLLEANKNDIVTTSYELMDSNLKNMELINKIYKQNGIDLNATNSTDYLTKGDSVTRDKLQEGDLILYKTSGTRLIPAIYIGEHRIIVADTGKTSKRMLFDQYYSEEAGNFVTARRFISTEDKSDPIAVDEKSTKADKIIDYALSVADKAKFGYAYDKDALTFTGAGFVHYLYKNEGVDLKSTLASGQLSVGTEVNKTNLLKGDLLYFTNGGKTVVEVGIYLGNNEFIYLSSRERAVLKDNLNSDWAKKNYVTARRVL
ncbi:NlpC/P60 family protein [Lederbergia panacisoli]|uniref:NlpC/P60 family protein n=1 Tax=Lederbergia panacisoli TaxID=1255251 RepID=UPI00214AAF89|nr:NlpC/P60 family protein [Lederbergia panacisoli]MCR2821957.1 NlpC/P60 family protein [Lederbergia panacisoli]